MKLLFSLSLVLMINSYCLAQKKTELYKAYSQNDFDTTMELLYSTLKEKQLNVFADFDHQNNAEIVGLNMPKSRVIVFGNPKAGTQLMVDNPEIALDLPLKIAIVENQQKVQVIFTNMATLSKKYKLKNKAPINKMQILMEDIVKRITEK